MKNHFQLYDAKGCDAATAKIKRAADALIETLEKHRRLGATDTCSMEAVVEYIWQNVRGETR